MPYPSVTTYPAVTTYPGVTSGTITPPAATPASVIRERPPTRLAVAIETPDGYHARWGIDESDSQNTPAAIVQSSTMPGGFEQFTCTLTRKPEVDYPDLTEFSKITVHGAGGDIAWQGRLETVPRTSGDQISINPGAVGHQSLLSDNNAIRTIYVDIDRTHWQPAALQRKVDLAGAGMDDDDASVFSDPTTLPALATQLTGPWGRARRCEAWYDAQGIPLGSLYYAWKLAAADTLGDNTSVHSSNWEWRALLSDDAVASAYDITANLLAAGPTSTGTLAATTAARKWAAVFLANPAAASTSQAVYALYWTCLAAYGNHGLPKQGVEDTANAKGLFASDVIAHAIGTWAPDLATTFAGQSTITATSYVINHLVFLEPATVATIIAQAARFGLEDWAVWDGPTFWFHPRGARGKSWRARVGPAKLQETGPQVDRIYNGVIVAYTDVDTTTRTVGPPGSNADTEDASLVDSDPQNPATLAGVKRWTSLTMGTGTAAAAIKIGSIFLVEQRALSTAGQAALTGHVQDAFGVFWPAWMVRAGDTIRFVDAAAPNDRRIVKADYADQNKTCTITLDSPPEGLSSLLARLSVALTPYGLT